jgi:hypothetical protein
MARSRSFSENRPNLAKIKRVTEGRVPVVIRQQR